MDAEAVACHMYAMYSSEYAVLFARPPRVCICVCMSVRACSTFDLRNGVDATVYRSSSASTYASCVLIQPHPTHNYTHIHVIMRVGGARVCMCVCVCVAWGRDHEGQVCVCA